MVEEVYAKERLLVMAVKQLNKKPESKSFKESLGELASDNFVTRKIIFQKARENVLKKTKGFYQAPLKILDVMEAGQMKGRAGYLSSESQAFGELCVSEQSKNLQHIFFMAEGAKKYSGQKGDGELAQLKRGATLGAGTMGGGIAWLMAKTNMMPIMKDLTVDALELGLKQASENFSGALKRRRLSYDEFEKTRAQLVNTLHIILTEKDREFLLSIKNVTPDWSIYDFERFPAVQWKLQNLNKLKTTNPKKHQKQYEALKEILKA